MRSLRIRWRSAWKPLAIAAIALLALRTLPALLTPPNPPPLAEDIGLPKVDVPAAERDAKPRPKGKERRHPRHRPHRTQRVKHESRQTPAPPASEPAPAPPPTPATPPAPAPPPPSAASPPPTSDGSLEFAPH